MNNADNFAFCYLFAKYLIYLGRVQMVTCLFLQKGSENTDLINTYLSTLDRDIFKVSNMLFRHEYYCKTEYYNIVKIFINGNR